jgi:hypothetical protein
MIDWLSVGGGRLNVGLFISGAVGAGDIRGNPFNMGPFPLSRYVEISASSISTVSNAIYAPKNVRVINFILK